MLVSLTRVLDHATGCAETVSVGGEDRPQETFPDCSRAYVGARRGCSGKSCHFLDYG